MIITGFALYSETASTLFLRRSVMWWNFSTGRRQLNGHSQLASAGDVADWRVVIGHVYMALREDIMSDDTVSPPWSTATVATNLAK